VSDIGRSERKPIDSTDDKDAAEPVEKNQEGLHRSKSDIDSSRDGYDVGPEPTEPCDESELGFAPSIELREKLDGNVSGSSGKPRSGFAPEIDLAARRDRNASGPSGKPRFGFAREMDLATKRDKPPTLAPPKRGNRVAQSDPPLLPYEAAQLAASTPPLRRPRLSGKLVPICLAVIIATASVVSAAIILSVDDDSLIPARAGASVVDRGATTTNLLDKDLKREVQAPKLDNLTSSAQRTAPITHSLGQSMVSDHREPLPERPVTSPPVGSPNLAAVTSVQKSERDGLKDRIEASLKTGGSPTNLAAAASWRSMTAKQDRKQQIDAGFNREEIDEPALRDDNAAPQAELPPKPESTSSTITAAVSKSPIDDGSRASADGMLSNDQDAQTDRSADLAKASVRSRSQPRSDEKYVQTDAQDDDVSAHRNAAFTAHQTLKETANRSEAPITARPPMLLAGDRSMNGAGLRQVKGTSKIGRIWHPSDFWARHCAGLAPAHLS